MRKIYFLLILFTTALTVSKAQIWAPTIGTYWYYTDPSNPAFCSPGYAKYDYYKDSLINGNNCQMIRRYRKAVCQNGPVASYYAPIYTYTNSNKVVYVNDVGNGFGSPGNVQTQVFDTLFWFNAPIGSKWQMSNQNYNCTFTNTSIVTVLDTGHTPFQGINLRWQKVSYTVQYGIGVQTATDTIYERFGYLRTDPFNPHNFCTSISDSQTNRYFRCYGDNQITNLKFRYTGNCEYFLDVGVREEESGQAFTVFPNPATSILYISQKEGSWKDATLELQDAFGRIVFRGAYTNQVDLSIFPAGIYLVTLKKDDLRHSVKIIKE